MVSLVLALALSIEGVGCRYCLSSSGSQPFTLAPSLPVRTRLRFSFRTAQLGSSFSFGGLVLTDLPRGGERFGLDGMTGNLIDYVFAAATTSNPRLSDDVAWSYVKSDPLLRSCLARFPLRVAQNLGLNSVPNCEKSVDSVPSHVGGTIALRYMTGPSIHYVFASATPSKPTNPGVAVLCYHDLQLVAKNDMTNTPKNFEAHMKWLKEHGYQTLSMDELVAVMKKKAPEPAKAVVITFDDGYEGVYKYAYPVMKRYGFKGVLFLVTSVMGDEKPPMPHLTWPQIEEMDSSGVIQAEVHAQRLHVKLGQRLASEKKKGIQPNDIIADLKGAKQDIESHTHQKVKYIAWPFGDYNTDLIRLASKLGYYAMVNTEYGLNFPGDNVVKIKRLRMSSGYDTLKRFESKLSQYGLR